MPFSITFSEEIEEALSSRTIRVASDELANFLYNNISWITLASSSAGAVNGGAGQSMWLIEMVKLAGIDTLCSTDRCTRLRGWSMYRSLFPSVFPRDTPTRFVRVAVSYVPTTCGGAPEPRFASAHVETSYSTRVPRNRCNST